MTSQRSYKKENNSDDTSVTKASFRNWLNLEFGIYVFFLFFCHIASGDKPVVSDGGNRSNRQKPPFNPKSLATLSLFQKLVEGEMLVRNLHKLTPLSQIFHQSIDYS